MAYNPLNAFAPPSVEDVSQYAAQVQLQDVPLHRLVGRAIAGFFFGTRNAVAAVLSAPCKIVRGGLNFSGNVCDHAARCLHRVAKFTDSFSTRINGVVAGIETGSAS